MPPRFAFYTKNVPPCGDTFFALKLLLFRKQLVVLLNRFANDLDGFIGTQRFVHGGLLVLQRLVDGEEVGHFRVRMLGKSENIPVYVVGGIAEGDRDDLLIGTAVVQHLDGTDGVAAHQRAGMQGLGAQYQYVQRVVVIGVGAGDHTVVGRVVGSSVEYTVKANDTRLFVKLVLAGRAFGNFNDSCEVCRGNFCISAIR